MAAVIVVADDEAAVRILLRRVLEEQGYKIYAAENGKEALVLFEALDRQVDLILADLVMPVMGGRELAENLQALGADLPMIFMTGWALDLKEAWAESACLLLKPFSSQELLMHVGEALSPARKAAGE